MNKLEGMKMKFIVIKPHYITEHLTEFESDLFKKLLDKIEFGRKCLKESDYSNKYLVINTDESYAEDVINIMKSHGHWGEGLPQGIKATESPSHGVTEAEAFGNDCRNGQC